MINDTVTSGPRYSVSLWTDVPNLSEVPSLCYQVIGTPNKTFNLLSDVCTSINAYYSAPQQDSFDKIITKIGIIAKDRNGQCKQIQVNADGCKAFIDNVNTVSYQLNDIAIQTIRNGFKVSVPNCGNTSIVSWITCSTFRIKGVMMLSVSITRGLNLRSTSHGIIGEYKYIAVSMA